MWTTPQRKAICIQKFIFIRISTIALGIAFIVWTTCAFPALGLAGSQEPRPHSYPFMVRITKYNRTVCGGTILTEDLILTQYGCHEKGIDELVTVHAGDHNVSVEELGEQRVKPLGNTLYNPWYANLDAPLFGDIAVMRITPAFRFTKYVQPVKLVSPDYLPEIGTEVTLVGWGAYFLPPQYHLSFLFPDVLQERNVSFVAGRCKRKGEEHEDVMCTPAGKSSCFGDDGGPALQTVNGELVEAGTISVYPYFGTRDCQDEGFRLPRPIVLLRLWYDWLQCVIRQMSATIYRVSLSSPLLQTMCMQKEKYDETKVIQPPIKSPSVVGNFPEIYMWSETTRKGIFHPSGERKRCPEPNSPHKQIQM